MEIILIEHQIGQQDSPPIKFNREFDVSRLKRWRKSFLNLIEELSKDSNSENRRIQLINKLVQEGKDLFGMVFREPAKNPAYKPVIDRLFRRTANGKPGRLNIVSKRFVFDYQFMVHEDVEIEGDTIFKSSEFEKKASLLLGQRYFITCQYTSTTSPMLTKFPSRLTYAFLNEVKDLFEVFEKKKFSDLEEMGYLELRHPVNGSTPMDIINNRDEYDFLYIICHIESDSANIGESYLWFGQEDSMIQLTNFESMSDLNDKMVFLNGCQGGHFKFENEESFAQKISFVRKADSLITPLIAVEEGFASEFASRFWEKLYNLHERRLDQALYYTSNHFLIEKGNIAGVYYHLYGKNTINHE